MATTKHEEQLYRVFDNVKDWHKFAEAKNAMLIAFNGASIYGLTRVFQIQTFTDSEFLTGYLIFIIVCLISSTVLALISFAPKVRLIKGGLFGTGDERNILFFEYLKCKTDIEIVKEITGNAESTSTDFAQIELDLGEQIRQNSIIASRKYAHFTIAVWITVTAYVTLPIAGLYFLFDYLKN
jgi:hypothetical protein